MWIAKTISLHTRFAQYMLIFAVLPISSLTWAQESETSWLYGDLELGLNAARAKHDSDIEIEQFLRLNIDPPKHERLHLRSTLWFTEDLDGKESPSSPFRSLNDTSDTWITSRVFSLYMEAESDQDDSKLRVGRQRITDGVAYNRIDGFYFSTRQANWNAYAFLGTRASVYENSHNDLSTGTGISWLAMPDTRIALDMFYGDDERRRFGSNNEDDIQSTLTSLSVRHVLNEQHYLFGRATWHESDLDEFRVTAQGTVDDEAIFYTLSYRKRVSTLAERPADFPQFYYVVGELNGYEDIQGVVSVPITDRIDIGLEAQVHEAEASMLTTANRDYQRYGVSFDIREIATHYDLHIILELWDAAHGESEKTISGEVSRQWEKTSAAVGVDYDRFQDRILQYDPLDQDDFFIESRDDIYALYIKVKHDFNERHAVQVRASVEEDDTSDAPYWRLRSHYTYRF